MALSALRDTPARTTTTRTVKLYTGVKVYQGGLVCIDTTHGYGVPASATTTLVPIGIATQTVDNTLGASGALSVGVRSGEIYRLNNGAAGSDFTIADCGSLAYTYDDATVVKSSSGASIAGVVEDVDSSGVWVRIGSMNDAALTSAATAASTLQTRLALTTGTYGALMVGLYDTATKYTATTVEAALAEDADGRRIATAATGNTIPAVPVAYLIAVPDGATGNVDTVLDATFGKMTITNVYVLKNTAAGGASDTIQLKNGTTNAITNAIDINVAANVRVPTTTIVSTYSTVSAGATLRVTRTKASAANVGCTVVVEGFRTA